MTYETFRLMALAQWLTWDALTIVDHNEVGWACECVAAGIVFA